MKKKLASSKNMLESLAQIRFLRCARVFIPPCEGFLCVAHLL